MEETGEFPKDRDIFEATRTFKRHILTSVLDPLIFFLSLVYHFVDFYHDQTCQLLMAQPSKVAMFDIFSKDLSC